MRHVLKMCFLWMGATSLLLFAFALFLASRRAQVEVSNLGPTTMHSVVVDVTGRSYSLGDIAVGTSKATGVSPRGESSVSIRHVNAEGIEESLWIDSYLESNYRGKMVVQIKNGRVAHVTDNIRPGP